VGLLIALTGLRARPRQQTVVVAKSMSQEAERVGVRD
jgi:hypothetical protein